MLVSSKAALVGTLLAATIVSTLFLASSTWRFGRALTLTSPQMMPGSHSSLEQSLMLTLNVASRIYVINLPRNTHRRVDMEQLQYTLGLDFTYVNGTEGDANTVRRIMRHVAALRTPEGSNQTRLSPSPAFGWPQDVDALVGSEFGLDMKGSDLWSSDDIDLPSPPLHEPLMCAHGDYTLKPYSSQTPPYQLLTKERVACWHSHWQVIRSIADGQDAVSLILEDDVDMELDIRQRLLGIWDALPSTWDIVFLGHAVRALSSCSAILTATQVTVGPKSPKSPQSPPITHRFQA